MNDLSEMSTASLLELHFFLYEAVEIDGIANCEEMHLYFRTRYELEDRGWPFLPGGLYLGERDAA